MGQLDNIKQPGRNGGMDTDSAFEDIHPNDFIFAQNLRNVGTSGNDANYATNIESFNLLSGSLPSGLNQIIGGYKSETTGYAYFALYNSQGYNQILQYNQITNSYTVLYTDLTNSGGIPLLNFNPQNRVNFTLLNGQYLIWWANGLEVGYTNVLTLASGGYGTVIWEDLSLLKPQCLIPPKWPANTTSPDVVTNGYGSDLGKNANLLYGKLPQIIVQYVNADYNYSAFSTRSKRFIPYQQNTPILGSDVNQNNYIIITVDIGSSRANVVNIGCQFDDSGQFYLIKSINRSYITALTNTSVDILSEVYEAYNSSYNTYSFAFYNNTLLIPIDINETYLDYDQIWPSNAACLINGNYIALADWTTLYPRPTTDVSIAAVGYNPNISIPANYYTSSLKINFYYPGGVGSGAGNHRRIMYFNISGSPLTGDIVNIITVNITNTSSTSNQSYPIPSSQNGNLLAVVQSISTYLGGSYVSPDGGTSYTIQWTGAPYFQLQTCSITNYYASATKTNSVPTVLDNAAYQLAIRYRDYKGRRFPLCTNNNYFITTKSFAQQYGNATQLNFNINTLAAPVGAVDYQIMITKPQVTKIVEAIGCVLNFKGSWAANGNSPNLLTIIPTPNIGDTYQITTPSTPAVPSTYTNIGTGEQYNTGDYVTNVGGNSQSDSVGQYFAVLPKTFGNIAGANNSNGILAFSINSLKLLNSQFSDESVITNLSYEYAVNDRVTLHYYIDGSGNTNYFNMPCIDLQVLGYDAVTGILKAENSVALTYSGGHIYYNGLQIDARNIYLRIYSPQPLIQTSSSTENETVFYEIGERYLVTNGQHSVTNINIVDGGAYYKTRQYPDAINPFNNNPISVLATDLHYSDFYFSKYYSFGRSGTYYDEKPQAESQASIITSDKYVIGSQINLLNRFYDNNIYGDNDGQTSSTYGSIQVLWQRGNTLIVMQPKNIFYIPVNETYQVLNNQLTGIAISEKLFNNGRYEPGGTGIGTAKESFCTRYDVAYFIDPNKSLPYKITLSGVVPISGKMSNYFKSVIQLAYSTGRKLLMFYNDFHEEVILAIQANNSLFFAYPFNSNWNPLNGYVISGSQVTSTPNGSNCTVSYNSSTGLATYIPTTGFVGNNLVPFSFNPGTGVITLYTSLNWTAGTTTVNPFIFNAVYNATLSTVYTSNSITVTGNNVAVAISITGGTYSINGGAYTSVAGLTSPNDLITVQVTSSDSNSTGVSATLSVGSTNGTFTVTTLPLTTNYYNVQSSYSITITGVANGSCTGTPTITELPLSQGSSVYVAYTTIGAGTVIVSYTGTPAIPGHTYFGLNVNGVQVSSQLIVDSGPTGLKFPRSTISLTFPSAVTSPTPISIYVYTA